jgi:hypothetical protein
MIFGKDSQAPALFKRLSESGQLEREAALASQEAERMFGELTKDAPKDKNGQPCVMTESALTKKRML